MLTISLPIPKSSNPNAISPGSWRKHAAARKAARQSAGVHLLAALKGAPAPQWPAVTMRVIWTARMPQHIPDDDNARARLKPVRDALQDVGIVQNDRNVFTTIEPEVRRDVPPGVVLHIAPKKAP